MAKWKKMAGIVVLLVLSAVVGGAWWFAENRARLRAVLAAAHDEGARFGQGHEDTACLDEALRRLEAHGNFLDETTRHQPFLESCLAVARRTAGFCSRLPPPGNELRWHAWNQNECAARSHDEPGCGRLMREVQRVCFPKAER